MIIFSIDPRDNYHLVLDCSKDLMRDHCYWPVVSDLINVLSHKPVAYKFMADERLLQLWFEITSCLQGVKKPAHLCLTIIKNYFKIATPFPQRYIFIYDVFSGMNLNRRELVQHVQYEPETYYAAFSAELEISLSPMWSLLAHCTTEVWKYFMLISSNILDKKALLFEYKAIYLTKLT